MLSSVLLSSFHFAVVVAGRDYLHYAFVYIDFRTSALGLCDVGLSNWVIETSCITSRRMFSASGGWDLTISYR